MARGSRDYQNMEVEAALERSIVEEIHLDESSNEVNDKSAEDADGQHYDRDMN